MQLLLIRHAAAEDADTFADQGGTDAGRPLTELGRKRMRKGANRLRSQLEAIAILACSPLRRARETAEIIARAFGDIPLVERQDLAPESEFESLLDWLRESSAESALALVGHAPHLNRLAGLLLAGEPLPLLDLKKGGVALLEFSKAVAPGAGTLRWLLTPAQLRSLKEG